MSVANSQSNFTNEQIYDVYGSSTFCLDVRNSRGMTKHQNNKQYTNNQLKSFRSGEYRCMSITITGTIEQSRFREIASVLLHSEKTIGLYLNVGGCENITDLIDTFSSIWPRIITLKIQNARDVSFHVNRITTLATNLKHLIICGGRVTLMPMIQLRYLSISVDDLAILKPPTCSHFDITCGRINSDPYNPHAYSIDESIANHNVLFRVLSAATALTDLSIKCEMFIPTTYLVNSLQSLLDGNNALTSLCIGVPTIDNSAICDIIKHKQLVQLRLCGSICTNEDFAAVMSSIADTHCERIEFFFGGTRLYNYGNIATTALTTNLTITRSDTLHTFISPAICDRLFKRNANIKPINVNDNILNIVIALAPIILTYDIDRYVLNNIITLANPYYIHVGDLLKTNIVAGVIASIKNIKNVATETAST